MRDFIFLGSKITADGDCNHEIKRFLFLGRKAMTKLDSILKIRHYFADKGPYSQSYGFSSSHVWIWELDHKEGWVLKNCVLDYKIKLIHPKGNQPWIFTGRTDAEAETPKLWPLMWRANSLEKTLMLGKIKGRRKRQQRMRWLDDITNSMDMSSFIF